MMENRTIALLVVWLYAFVPLRLSAADDLPGVEDFVDEMVLQYAFDRTELEQLFAEVETQPGILELISRPAEKRKPWYEYRRIFLTPGHIEKGVAFWEDNQRSLARVQEQFGVAPEIIVAILGVETRYGRHTGRYRVIDSLATLAFRYPPRSRFFRQQLAEFLLLAREEDWDPRHLTGSYAGAMGLIQFMPDSFRTYAVDFDQDGRRDIWESPEDAVGSVANFLKRKGDWRAGAPIAHRVRTEEAAIDYQVWVDKGPKPTLPLEQLRQGGVSIPASVAEDERASVLLLEGEEGAEVWLGFHNFNALMRYNPSPMYAMAVYQLATVIRTHWEGRCS
jgi:membrane-bound lytic murein transglycosylase B